MRSCGEALRARHSCLSAFAQKRRLSGRALKSVDSDSFRARPPTSEGVFKSPQDVQACDRLRACADSAGAAGSGVRRNRISEICLSKRRDRGMEVSILAFYIG